MSRPPAPSICGLIALLALAQPASAKLDLCGRVLSAEGAPLGNASVFIYTAAPRTGPSLLCPYCYPDCRKSARTDDDGSFVVPGLSDSLTFRVLATSMGFAPAFVDSVDPVVGAIEARLTSRDLGQVDLSLALRGRVADPLDRPVVGATVRPVGWRRGDWRRFGSRPGADPLSVTDENGEFLIVNRDTFEAAYVNVTARGLAPCAFSDVPVGADSVRLALRYGATVSGRVLKAGKPLTGVTIGLADVNQFAGSLYYRERIATDARGRFTFLAVPPRQSFVVYGAMESFAPFGALSPHPIMTGEEGSSAEVAGLAVAPAHRLAGRVVLADGKPVPPGTKLRIVRARGGDALEVTLDAGGRFRAEGIPTEPINIHVVVKGYRYSRLTPGFATSEFEPTLGVDRDLDDVEVVLEPNPPASRAR